MALTFGSGILVANDGLPASTADFSVAFRFRLNADVDAITALYYLVKYSGSALAHVLATASDGVTAIGFGDYAPGATDILTMAVGNAYTAFVDGSGAGVTISVMAAGDDTVYSVTIAQTTWAPERQYLGGSDSGENAAITVAWHAVWDGASTTAQKKAIHASGQSARAGVKAVSTFNGGSISEAIAASTGITWAVDSGTLSLSAWDGGYAGAGAGDPNPDVTIPTSGLIGLYIARESSAQWQNANGTTPAAQDDLVGRTDDLSGRGNHATQSDLGLRPILRKDANDCYYTEHEGGTVFELASLNARVEGRTQWWAAFAVVHLTVTLGEYYTLLLRAPTGNDRVLIEVQGGNGDVDIYTVRQTAGSWEATWFGDTPTAPGDKRVIAGGYDGSSVVGRLDLDTPQVQPDAAGIGTGGDVLRVGSTSNAGERLGIYGWAIYDHVPSSATQSSVIAALQALYTPGAAPPISGASAVLGGVDDVDLDNPDDEIGTGLAVISTLALPDAEYGQPWTATLIAWSPTPVTWVIQTDAPGVSLNSDTGVMTWTPGLVGTFTLTAFAHNRAGTVSRTFSLTVRDQAVDGTPRITALSFPLATQGVAYSGQVIATGDAPITFSAAGLPTGMSIDGSTGAVTGTPSAVGTYTVTITASNSIDSDSRTFSMSVIPAGSDPRAPQITTSALVAATQGASYSMVVQASGDAPVTFSATGLPAGLSISASGAISGTTYAAAGPYVVSITASNSYSADTKAFSLVVRAGSVSIPVITTRILPPATVGTTYSVTWAADGAGPLSWEFTGLPPGIVADGPVLSGNPTHAGTYVVTARAQNQAGYSTPVSLQLLVNPMAADLDRFASPWAATIRR